MRAWEFICKIETDKFNCGFRPRNKYCNAHCTFCTHSEHLNWMANGKHIGKGGGKCEKLQGIGKKLVIKTKVDV